MRIIHYVSPCAAWLAQHGGLILAGFGHTSVTFFGATVGPEFSRQV